MDDRRAKRWRKHGWRRVRRVLARVAVAIVSIYALFVATMNVFLSTSLFEKVLDQDPDTIFISYERGWSIWPGRVHARRLTIRSSDSNVQFLLRLETCRFTFALGELAFRKTFHVTQVEGSGITFQARRRVPAPAATPEYVDSIPQIPGFERIPLPPLEPPDLLQRWDDRYYHLWTVQLDNVVAEDVREVWIDGVRWEGESRVTGGFFLKPIREAHVDDVHVDMRRGHVTALQRLIAEPIAGTIDVNIEPFDPRVVQMTDVVRRVTMRTDLHGRVPDLANLPPRLLAPVKIAGPAELHRLAVRIVHGKVVGDTHVDVAVPGASVEVAGHRAAGDLVVVGDVTDDAGSPRLTFHIDAHALTATRTADQPGLLARAPSLMVTGDARALDLGEPLRDLHAVASLEESELPDARLLEAYVPPGARPTLSFVGGRARARGKIEIWLADRRAKGEASLEAGEIEVRAPKVRIRGVTTVDASVDAWRWEVQALEGVKAKVRVANGSMAREAAPSRNVIEARAFELGFEAPEVDVDDPLRAFSARLEIPDAEIVDPGLVRGSGNGLRIARGHARFDARSELEVKDHKGSGTLALHASRFGLTLAGLSLSSDVRARGRVHDWALERGELAVDEASVVLTNVDVKLEGKKASALTIPRIALHASSDRFELSDPLDRLDLSGSIAGGQVKDPSALNAVLPKGTDVVFDTEPGQGRFDAELHAKVRRHVARGSVAAHGQGIGVRGKKIGIRGDVEATAELADWRMGEPKLRVKSSRITLSEVAVRFGERNPAVPAPPPDLLADRVELHASVDTIDGAQKLLQGVDYRLILDGARMDDVRPLGVLFSGDPLAFAVESGKARAAVDITVRASDKTASGNATIVLEDAGVRVHETHFVGDFQVLALVDGFDAELDGVNLSGSKIRIGNVATRGAQTSTSGWSGEVTLLGGAVRVSERPAFDGLVQLRADDANPILALALQNSLPQVVVGMLRAPGLSGQARVTIEPGRSAILGAHLRGDDVVLIGHYVVAGGHVRGAATVAKGPLSVGVRVDDGGTHLRLFALDSWMKKETAAALKLFGEAKGGAPTKPR